MKKIFLMLLVLGLLFSNLLLVRADDDLIANARSGILIEYTTGTIIYEKNIHERMSVASMTKMVGLIIIFERIADGTLSLDDMVKISANASGMGGSQIYLETGEEMSVRDLIKGITMASANDGIVAMAEKIAGTESEFVKLMNNKIAELGLSNTRFANCTGLDEKDHYSTAYDMAMIARELLKHEKILEFTSIYEDYLRQNTDNKFWLVNTNKLVRTYGGVDGLKTGFTDDALYCMTVTGKKNNMRLIAVVLGEPTGKVRNAETASLLDYGFNLYEVTKIKNKGDIVGNISIDKANKEKIRISVTSDVVVLKKQSEKAKEYVSEVKLNELKLPLKKGEVIGKLLVKENSNTITEVDIVIDENVEKSNFFKLFFNTFKNFVSGELA